MPELLSPFAPLHPWLLKRCARNLRVVRNPDDPFSLHHEGEIEIATYSSGHLDEGFNDIMLSRRDGPPDDRWVSWRRSSNYRADCRHFATRAMVLEALAAHGHSLPWALGGIWSALTDEQAARVTAEAVRAVGPSPGEPSSIVPIAALRQWSPHHCDQLAGTAFEGRVRGKGRSRGWEWRVWNRGAGMPPMAVSGPETGDAGCAMANATAQSLGALLWEQITPPEKAPDAP